MDIRQICDMLEAAQEATGTRPKVCGSSLSNLSVISKYGNRRAYAFGAGCAFIKGLGMCRNFGSEDTAEYYFDG